MTRPARIELFALIGAGAVGVGVRETLGICTSAVEVFGLALAVHIHTPRRRLRYLSLSSGGRR
jgi:hypothetical protein